MSETTTPAHVLEQMQRSAAKTYGIAVRSRADDLEDALGVLPAAEASAVRRVLAVNPPPTRLQDPVDWAYLQLADEKLLRGAARMQWSGLPLDGRLLRDAPTTSADDLLRLLCARYVERFSPDSVIADAFASIEGRSLLLGTVPGIVGTASTRRIGDEFLVVFQRGLLVLISLIGNIYERAQADVWTTDQTSSVLRLVLDSYLLRAQPEQALSLVRAANADDIRAASWLAVQFVLLHEYSHIAYGDASLTEIELATHKRDYEESVERAARGNPHLRADETRRFNPSPLERFEFRADACALELLIVLSRYLAADTETDPARTALLKLGAIDLYQDQQRAGLKAAAVALLAQGIVFDALNSLVPELAGRTDELLAGYPNPWSRYHRLGGLAVYDAMIHGEVVDEVLSDLDAVFSEPIARVSAVYRDEASRGIRPGRIHLPPNYVHLGRALDLSSDQTGWYLEAWDDEAIRSILERELTTNERAALRDRAQQDAAATDASVRSRALLVLETLSDSGIESEAPET